MPAGVVVLARTGYSIPGSFYIAISRRSSVDVIRLRLFKRLVNLLPVAQHTNTFTNGVDGRTRTCA